MKKRTKEQVAKVLGAKASKMEIQEKLIEELNLKLKLRERLIDEQRSHIEILKAELNKKKWWRIL